MPIPDPKRTKDLARIHLAKKELGLDDDTYRALVKATTGKTSSADLGPGQRWKLMLELARLGSQSCPGDRLRLHPRTPAPDAGQAHPGAHSAATAYPGKPTLVPVESQALLSKVEALLAEARRPWAYAHAMAHRMFKRTLVQECDPEELRKLVAALVYDAKRNGRA